MFTKARAKLDESLRKTGALGEILTTPVNKKGLASLGLAGLTLLPTALQAKDGFYVGGGGEFQFFSEDGPLQDIYLYGYGPYAKAGGRYAIFDGSLKIGHLFGKGDKNEIENLFGGREINKNLGITYFGPHGRISIGPIFFKAGYDFYGLSNQVEEITKRWFEKRHITRTDNKYLKGATFGGGFSKSFQVEDEKNNTLDVSFNLEIDYRTAEVISGPSFNLSLDVTF